MQGQEQGFWRDKEKRRALLLSLFIHLLGIAVVLYAYVVPAPLEPENFIVLDLGAPEQADESLAAAADDPAPQAAEPEVASEAAGSPRTRTAEAAEPARSEAAQTPAETQQAQAPAAPAPAPQAPAPSTDAPLELPAQEAATTLPEIDDVDLEPQPLAESIQIPQPQAATDVPEARRIASMPRVQVAAAQEVPAPEVQASVAAPENIPTPEASATVAQRTIPTPQAAAQTANAQSVPTPDARASVPTPRALETNPSIQVAEAEAVPDPQVTATANLPDSPEQTAEVADDTQSGDQSAQAEANAVGGNAPDTGQTQAEDAARTGNVGAAATPSAAAPAAGAPASRTPYEVSRRQPIAVILDNARGYPQAGLQEASVVFEMPVEGGLTRLMSVYDNPNATPSEVGPIRSAREYFVQAAGAMNGTLVHVGGSPSALSEIARGRTTLDALQQTEPFFVASNQRAPYSTYAEGSALRQAIARLELDASRVLSGSKYLPAERAPNAPSLSVAFSGDYASGFRYIPSVSQYRWLRNGREASDASGQDVLVEAVVAARVTAFPYPGDPEGRLYLPYSGGAATLYLRGKKISGSWTPQNGLTFIAEGGETIDLAPYKHWLMFVPEYAEVSDD